MLDFRKSLIDSTLRKVLKRLHYPLSLRQVEKMIAESEVFSLTTPASIAGR